MTRPREELVVPQAEFDSYYGRPILKEPTWHALDIAGYFFAGGLSGASSLLAAAADLSGNPALRRASRLGALGGIGVSLVGLVHDLGRPSRFLNMLRVAKPTSPMSVGSWLLAAYGPLTAIAAGSELFREWSPRSASGRTSLPTRGCNRPLANWPLAAGRAAGIGAAGLGTGVATYTAVLIADTAAPSWHEAYRELPFVFAGSAAASAGGLALLTVHPSRAGQARLFGALGAVAELVAARRVEHAPRLSAEPYRSGRAGALLTAARMATVLGTAVAAGPARRSRRAAWLSGLALLAGSALTRFGVFEAGRQSTRDPRYVVVPQRQE